MLQNLGRMEHPIGSNSGQFVDSIEAFFGMRKQPWCAMGASLFNRESKISPIVWSPLALKFATGNKYSIKQVNDGKYNPKPGDYLVWNYGHGKGHVDEIIRYDSTDKTWLIIGANRNDGINVASLTTTKLLLTKAYCVVSAKEPVEFTAEDVFEVVKSYYGIATYYHPGLHGKRTASGERYDSNQFTAAHRTLPFGTRIKITNPQNSKNIVVKINDRGPFIKNREIDLSRAAAKKIGISKNKVFIQILR